MSALLKGELQRRGVTPRGLAERLARMGLPETEQELEALISQGEFTTGFFVQCFEAIGAPVITLDF
jgi:hypothetical protein